MHTWSHTTPTHTQKLTMGYEANKCFPGVSVVKNLLANAGDAGLISGSGRFPGEGNHIPTPVFLPGESHGQKSPVASQWSCKELNMA